MSPVVDDLIGTGIAGAVAVVFYLCWVAVTGGAR